MSVATPTDTARRWTCGGCGVSVSRLDGSPARFPENWDRSDDELFCLGCRRERAAEAALQAAPAGAARDTRAKLRRAGLIEFEVRRAPERTDGAIAKACRASVPAVAAARRAIAGDDPEARKG